MTNEEKYKLALFGVIRNNTVLPVGMRLGKTAFLTKEEAEQALERMEKENGNVD